MQPPAQDPPEPELPEKKKKYEQSSQWVEPSRRFHGIRHHGNRLLVGEIFGISALAGAVLTAVGVFIERATLHDGPLPSGKKAFILIGSAAACLILSLGGLGYSLWRYRQRTEEAAPLRYLILPPLRYTIPPARFEAEPLLSSNVAPRFPEQRV